MFATILQNWAGFSSHKPPAHWDRALPKYPISDQGNARSACSGLPFGLPAGLPDWPGLNGTPRCFAGARSAMSADFVVAELFIGSPLLGEIIKAVAGY